VRKNNNNVRRGLSWNRKHWTASCCSCRANTASRVCKGHHPLYEQRRYRDSAEYLPAR